MIAVSSFLECKADEINNDIAIPYIKIGLGYITAQPNEISLTQTYFNESIPFNQSLYNDSNRLKYTLETGLQVNRYRLGLAWTDKLDQSAQSKKIYHPYLLEVFIEQDYPIFDWCNLVVGAGFKLFEDHSIHIENKYGYHFKDYEMPINFTDNISARIALTKRIGSYEIGLYHHSQWFRGKPFNNDWEPYTTELRLSYQL